MYTRPYFKDSEELASVPENYSGVAMSEEARAEPAPIDENVNPWESGEPRSEDAASASAISRGLLGGFSDIFRGGSVKNLLSGIGSEEILIIAVALFLFLSRDGDKECAVMLLLLLII